MSLHYLASILNCTLKAITTGSLHGPNNLQFPVNDFAKVPDDP
jgi:hypothetical protein